MVFTGFIGNSLRDPLTICLGLLALGLAVYLVSDMVRRARERHKKQEHRHRQRREFWGYE